jgi:uncharacterized membrane protein (UPF0136 family)
MAAVSASKKIAAVLAALYGAASLVGGIIGFASKGSVPSLVAGGVCGVLLLICAVFVFRRPTLALAGAVIVSLALLGFFLPKALNPPTDPEKQDAATRAIGMSVGGVLVLLSAGFALVKCRTCKR